MKNNRQNGRGLTAEQKALREVEREVLRRQEEIRRNLEKMPARLKEKREEVRHLQRIYSTTTARGEYLARKQHHRGLSTAAPKHRPLRIKRKQGKWKFLILCFILLILLILLWYAMPS